MEPAALFTMSIMTFAAITLGLTLIGMRSIRADARRQRRAQMSLVTANEEVQKDEPDLTSALNREPVESGWPLMAEAE